VSAPNIDSERLDWILSRNWLVIHSKDHEYCGITRAYYDDGEIQFETVARAIYDTPREALDAAIKKVEA
jgi:hypothetical protein